MTEDVKQPLNTGDPVRVTKMAFCGDTAAPIEIEATVIYADARGVGVAYADGTREVVQRQYVVDARAPTLNDLIGRLPHG